jgi:dTDP-glucose 4,6-dehydratase
MALESIQGSVPHGAESPRVRERTTRVLLTGGAGFIGSVLVRRLICDHSAMVVNCDKLTYAAVPAALREVEGHHGYHLERVDICNRRKMEQIFRDFRPTSVIHFAAETHVDRSIEGPLAFIRTNVFGTGVLLEVSSGYYRELNEAERATFRFHHVSTDEVFGSLPSEGPASGERDAYAPNSPYSASKASADHLVRAWHRTYALPVVITHGSNTFGPWQFPDKFIPVMIINALRGRSMPIYGTGENIRDWLYVEDHVEALWRVWCYGATGGSYNIGGGSELTNRQLAVRICRLLDRVLPDSPDRPHERLVTFVADRPGHDFRYALDTTKIRNELGWRPHYSFDEALERCVRWYIENRSWWEGILATKSQDGRLGLRKCGEPGYDGANDERYRSCGR